MNEEVWRPVAGYSNYAVSSYGNIKSLKTEKILKAVRSNRQGYLQVTLSECGVTRNIMIHRLVCETFNGSNCDNLWVLHVDGNNQNNRADNLRWGTASENMFDQVLHGTNKEKRKKECPRGHKLAEPNLSQSELKRGHRICLTCRRANKYIIRYEARTERTLSNAEKQAIYSEYYARIAS